MDRVEQAGRRARAERVSEMILLGFDDQVALAEGRVADARARARVAWALGAADRLRAALAAADAAWMRLIDEEDAEERFGAGGGGGAGTCERDDGDGVSRVAAADMEVEAVQREIDAFIADGCFPRHLYFAAV